MTKYLLILWMLLPVYLLGQKDSTHFFHRNPVQKDSSVLTTRQDAIYQRPTLLLGKTQTAIGGYLEGNVNYLLGDKAPETNMELRRMNIFLYSTIARRIKFLSEIEFEPAEAAITLETALMDFEINPALNLRAGILLAPVAGFNQRHDAPLWEFVERPLVSTEIIPSTLSEMGAGIHGKFYAHNKVFSYDLYAVNGLQSGIILNSAGRTYLQSGKNAAIFGADNNSSPAVTGKFSFRHRKIGEAGISAYHGAYNDFKREGIIIAKKQSVSIFALDFNTTIAQKAAISGEYAYDLIQVPESAGPTFGSQQQGVYIECVYPVLKRKILKYDNTTLNLALRLEAVDYNMGKFSETGENKGDEIKGIVAGISLRPSGNTVLKLNYRWRWTTDLQGNDPVLAGGIQAGFATYF